MINHGTRSGYYAHRRLSEDPCDECRAAINEYMRDYREKRGVPPRNKERERLRRRALSILRERYRAEYDEILRGLEVGDLR